MPELRHLRVFVAVAEERNFTRAAERLHLAQQAVSKSVAALERELGVDLLTRTTREVRLTAAGEALLADAPAVVEAAERAFARARDHGRGMAGRLVVGTSAAVGAGVLDPAILALRAEAPDLAIAFRDVRPRELAAELRAGTIDVALGRTIARADDLEQVELPPTPAVLAVPEGHALATRDRVALRELDGLRLLVYNPPGTAYTDLLVGLCAAAGATVMPVESGVLGSSSLLELAPQRAVAIVPGTRALGPGVVALALEDDVTLPLVAQRLAGPPAPAVARLLTALRAGR